MATELISILLPIYNAAATLDDCLAGILGQTHRRFEVIAVDDGPTDSTPERLARYAARDRRIKIRCTAPARRPRPCCASPSAILLSYASATPWPRRATTLLTTSRLAPR